jgi:heme A synthase
LVVLAAVTLTTAHIWHWHRPQRDLIRPATLLLLFVCSQATLGALVVMSALQPIINTAHVVNGALVLATSLVLTLRVFHRTLQPVTGDVKRSRRADIPLLEKDLREVHG